MRYKQHEVLRSFQPDEEMPSQATIRKHYDKWRSEQIPPLPQRCDNKECMFHTKELIWNNKNLKLILDHKRSKKQNKPSYLRLLCPNCNSQLYSDGGGNKGRSEYQNESTSYTDFEGNVHTEAYMKGATYGITSVGGKLTHKKSSTKQN